MMSTPGHHVSSPYAPVNDAPTAEGAVRYVLGGLQSLEDGRRADAYKQMFTTCGGTYEITREEDAADGSTGVVIGGVVSTQTIPYRVIHFRCAPAAGTGRVITGGPPPVHEESDPPRHPTGP